MRLGVKGLLLVIIFWSNGLFAQKAKNFLGVNAGVELFSNSILLPYENSNADGNRTGEIQFTSANPVWSFGINFDRVYKNGLVLKATLNWQSPKYGFSTSNNQFEYQDNILISYLTLDFNRVEYQLNMISTDAMIGINAYHDRTMAFSMLVGPRVLYAYNSGFSHAPGPVFTNGETSLEDDIGSNHINNFIVGFTIMPQIIFEITKSLRLATSLNLAYYFKSFVDYNGIFDSMTSSPFKENSSPTVGVSFRVGLLYEL